MAPWQLCHAQITLLDKSKVYILSVPGCNGEGKKNKLEFEAYVNL